MQSTNEYVTDFGHLHLRIEEILKDRGISKTKVCKELDIPRTISTDIVRTNRHDGT